MVEVLATARQARIPPREWPVLLEQPVGYFHRHVRAIAHGVLLLGVTGAGSLSCFVLRNGHPFPMVMSVAVGCRRGAGRLVLF